MQTLRNKVAVITGGASGIGRAIAEALIERDCRIVLADIEESTLAATAEELSTRGAEVLAVPTDVTDADQLVALADAAECRFGTTHLVFNNAGVAPIGAILETSIEDFRWVIDVNLLGVVHGIAAFGPRLVAQGEGHIVNTASSGGLLTVAGFGAYVATKHAVVGLSETLYQELAGTGVGVSVLCPGLVATRIFESERNRPATGGASEVASDSGSASAYGAAGEAARAAIAAMGMAPAEIAAHVVEAIEADRMYILPSPEVRPVVEERFRRILAGENPQILAAPSAG